MFSGIISTVAPYSQGIFCWDLTDSSKTNKQTKKEITAAGLPLFDNKEETKKQKNLSLPMISSRINTKEAGLGKGLLLWHRPVTTACAGISTKEDKGLSTRSCLPLWHNCSCPISSALAAFWSELHVYGITIYLTFYCWPSGINNFIASPLCYIWLLSWIHSYMHLHSHKASKAVEVFTKRFASWIQSWKTTTSTEQTKVLYLWISFQSSIVLREQSLHHRAVKALLHFSGSH